MILKIALMPLEAGRTLAHYEILEPIGEGGMGEVFHARDTKLKRNVAIKVLPEAFASEAEVLASFNHPNIAAIFGLEDQALVLELVEGPTLADRITRGPIPVDEVIAIAKQIAEALEAAHEQGIIHRDLKPVPSTNSIREGESLLATDRVHLNCFGHHRGDRGRKGCARTRRVVSNGYSSSAASSSSETTVIMMETADLWYGGHFARGCCLDGAGLRRILVER